MTLKGTPASQGTATGTARVITSLDNLDAFQPSDILVTIATSPSWTPLIHTASAIVTEFGGSLSHAAIVSREYGIPAVVGIKNATKKIKSGSTIKVDGTNGTVTLVEN